MQDAVITGHDRDEVGALIFLGAAALTEPRERVHQHLAAVLRKLASEPGGSSTCLRRLLVCSEPPSLDAGEITDKGYINQRATLERRRILVERLLADPPHPDLITP